MPETVPVSVRVLARQQSSDKNSLEFCYDTNYITNETTRNDFLLRTLILKCIICLQLFFILIDLCLYLFFYIGITLYEKERKSYTNLYKKYFFKIKLARFFNDLNNISYY